MSFKVLSGLCVTALVFAAGFWLGKTSGAQAQSKARVFELRTYTANDGKLADLSARFRDRTFKLFEKHEITNVGYWVPQDEPLAKNTLLYIVAHPDRDAARKAWEAFQNDPEWKKVRAETEANGTLAAKVESVFLQPTEYSPLK